MFNSQNNKENVLALNIWCYHSNGMQELTDGAESSIHVDKSISNCNTWSYVSLSTMIWSMSIHCLILPFWCRLEERWDILDMKEGECPGYKSNDLWIRMYWAMNKDDVINCQIQYALSLFKKHNPIIQNIGWRLMGEILMYSNLPSSQPF